MDTKKRQSLEQKLNELRSELERLEIHGDESIRQKRIDADMGDDYRENEGAKLVMEQHDIHYIRKVELRKEIFMIKKQLLLPSANRGKTSSK